MKILLLLIITAMILNGCFNDRDFYALTFKTDSLKNVSSSLYQLRTILKKLPKMSGNELSDTHMVVRHDPGLSAIHYDGENLTFNLTNRFNWAGLKKHPESFLNSPSIRTLSKAERRSLFNLVDLMIRNEINGVECCSLDDPLTSFFFRAPPFADRTSMIILCEDDFLKLSASNKRDLLSDNIIIDRKCGLVLMALDKARFLRYIYGGEDKIPTNWKGPTEQVFKVH